MPTATKRSITDTFFKKGRLTTARTKKYYFFSKCTPHIVDRNNATLTIMLLGLIMALAGFSLFSVMKPPGKLNVFLYVQHSPFSRVCKIFMTDETRDSSTIFLFFRHGYRHGRLDDDLFCFSLSLSTKDAVFRKMSVVRSVHFHCLLHGKTPPALFLFLDYFSCIDQTSVAPPNFSPQK